MDGAELRRMLGEPKKAIRSLAWALLFSYLVIQVNLFVDTAWASGLGDSDLSALSMMAPVYWLIAGVGVGLGVGASACISFRIGKDDMRRASALAENAIVLGLISSAATALIVWVLLDPIISFMGADDVREGCREYAFPFIALAGAIIMNGVVSGLLRSEGAGKRSIIILTVSAGLNMVLDPALIYWAGMGISGAGWATSIGALASTLIGLYWYMDGSMNVRISFRGYRPDRASMSELMGIAGPRTTEATVTSVTNIIQRVFIIIAGGTVAVMMYNVPFRYCTLIAAVSEAIGAAMIPVCSAAIGQGDIPKMKLGLSYSARISAAVTVALSAAVFILAEPLIGIFTTEPSMAEHSDEMVWVLRMFCIFIPFDGLRKLGSCMLQVLRRSKMSSRLVLIWGVAKLAAYAAVCTVSFHALIIACVAVYIFGGILMTGTALWISSKTDYRNAPAEPGGADRSGRQGPRSKQHDAEFMVLQAGFEPESRPRKGRMIGRYTTGAVPVP